MKEVVERTVDPQLWHACAGGLIQMPLPNSKVFYFPQGHAEHTLTDVDFSAMPRVPAYIHCRVIDVKFMADLETDEVYAKIRLSPLGSRIDYECDDDSRFVGTHNGSEPSEKPSSFAKTLTQSDANNGGGFSVPRYCAETIFPRLDYSADPPVQTIIAKDVHGEIWKFRHIYRGTPRRHLLTTGWSTFVNQKKLVAGDSIVFMRAENGDLCVGIRRAKRGGNGGPDSPSGWSSTSGSSGSCYGGFSVFLKDNENRLMRTSTSSNRNLNSGGRGKVRPESVTEATSLAANGQPFEVSYYPRASTPEYCVKASSVTAALRIQWCAGMRFKMAFETDDSSRISCFVGTVSSVQFADPFRWPGSPWRLLQVTWDEPDLLPNVKRVSPWLVDLVSNMPVIPLSPFSPQRKKLRLPQPPDLPRNDRYGLPSFTGNPLGPSSTVCCLSDNIPAGIQGARHARFGIPLLDLDLTHKLQLGLFPSGLKHLDPHASYTDGMIESPSDSNNDDISCLLTMGRSSHNLDKINGKEKAPLFLLFGQPIHTEQQISSGCYSDADSQVLEGKHSSDSNSDELLWSSGFQTAELGLDTGHCKVFLESEDVGRTLDLSTLGSYEELHRTLANLFGIERLDNLTHMLYKDATGAVKHIGEEPFSEFVRKAKRLTILLDTCSQDDGRKWITGLHTSESGLDSSNQTSPMTIFA